MHNADPTVEEINELIRRLAAYRPLADFLRALGINPKTDEAKRLTAFMLAHMVLGVKKLPRPKPATDRWTIAHDVALHTQVIRLQRDEGLSERAAVAKIAANWNFPYKSQAGRRSPKFTHEQQRAAALLSRWSALQRRLKLVEKEVAKVGDAGFWAQALGVPTGETRCQNRGFQFTTSAMHSASIDSNCGTH
jgi:hypothetical protein